jgi:hypothetical protein
MPTPSFSAGSIILTQARSECAVGANPNSTALQNEAAYRRLSDIEDQFVNYPYTVGMLGWKFLDTEFPIETIGSTTLSGAISSGATSLMLVSGTNWYSPSSDLGGGYIKSEDVFDFFVYEARTSGSLTIVSGIQKDHANAVEVHKIYELPANYGKSRNLFKGTYPSTYIDSSIVQIPRGNEYTTKSFTGTNYSRSFLILPEDIGADNFKFFYMKAPVAITEAGAENISAPDGVGRRFYIEMMKSYIWSVLGEENEAAIAQQKAMNAIEALASEWAVAHVQSSQNLILSW